VGEALRAAVELPVTVGGAGVELAATGRDQPVAPMSASGVKSVAASGCCEFPLRVYFVEKLADTIAGNIFGGRLTTTRCAIVDPGPF
jgi:hypothetical protein